MSKVVKYGLIAAGAGLAVFLIARATKKPTIGESVGQVIDGTKSLFGSKARLVDNAPFAAHSPVADSRSFQRMTGVGPQPEGQMDFTQRATTGLIRGSKFGFGN